MSVKAKRWLITIGLALGALVIGLAEPWWKSEIGKLLHWDESNASTH